MIQTALDLLTGFGVLWIFVDLERLGKQKLHNQRLIHLLNTCKYSPLPLSQEDQKGLIDFDARRAGKDEGVGVALPFRQTRKNIFSRTYQAQKVNRNFYPCSMGFLEGVTGGSWKMNQQGNNIKVDIKECNIEENLLVVQVKPLQVIKDKTIKFQSLTYSVKDYADILLVGTLTYNFDQGIFCLQPSFLLQHLNPFASKQDVFKNAFSLVNSKNSSIITNKILHYFLLLAVIFLRRRLIANIIEKVYRWARSFFFKQPGFKDSGKVYARKVDKLKCTCGRIMDTIYQCGHIAICSKCDEGLEIKSCRICGNVSQTTNKIFT